MNENRENIFRGEPPVLFDNKENCCGCSACYAVCPARAIVMEADEEGFLYPEIIEEKCIRCARCLSVCAFKADQRAKGFLHTPA
ncbi:4Fe-4S dicluster domain-containing protein [Clostridiaceae bacterium]|nr:4Fe-4S dicluster domain-containing protein [Clostridiaceae bacterium]